MNTKPGTRLKKPRPPKSPLSPQARVRILILLLPVLPIATGLLVAGLFGWGFDGALFGVMTGGIVFALLLPMVLLPWPPLKRIPGRAKR